MEINQLHDFRNHPFKVEVNTELCELMKSIEKEGVLVPLLVRTKVLLAAAKMAEKIVDVVYEKVVEKEVPVLVEEQEQAVEIREKVQLPKKPEEPLLLSKYLVIMELDVELKRRNKEIFAVEQERGDLEIELSECSGVFKQKQRKELQERITLLDKKDVYEQIPVMESEKFLLREIEDGDADDLLKVYSDKDAVPLFNSDNCVNGFYYTSIEEMQDTIAFWKREYKNRYYVRWAIIDKNANCAIGTIELFNRKAKDYFNNCGLLRLLECETKR